MEPFKALLILCDMSDNVYVIPIVVRLNVFSFEICMLIGSPDTESAPQLALHLVKSYFINEPLFLNEPLITKLKGLTFPYIVFCDQLFSNFFPQHLICHT